MTSVPGKTSFGGLAQFLQSELLGSIDVRVLNRLLFSFYAEGFGKRPEDRNRHTSLLKTQPENTFESVLRLEGFVGHSSLHLRYKIKLRQDVLYLEIVRRLPNFGFLSEEVVAKLLQKKDDACLFKPPTDKCSQLMDHPFEGGVQEGHPSRENSNLPRPNPDSIGGWEGFGDNSVGLFARDHLSDGNSQPESRGLKRIAGFPTRQSAEEAPDSTAKPKEARTSYNRLLDTLYSKIEGLK